MKKTMWLSYYLSMAMYFDQEDPDQRPKTNPEKWKKEEIPERLPYEWEYTGSSPNSLIRDLFIFLPSESRAFAWAYNGFSTQSAFPSCSLPFCNPNPPFSHSDTSQVAKLLQWFYSGFLVCRPFKKIYFDVWTSEWGVNC